MAYACNCKGIPERVLREELAKAVGKPVDQESLHRTLGGNDNNCCQKCRAPEADRLFAVIVTEHNKSCEQTGCQPA